MIVKSKKDMLGMVKAGAAASLVLDMIGKYVGPGVTTEHLNNICHNYIVNKLKDIPAPLNYKGFPKSICTSVNEVACHGIPDSTVLKSGDILNIDVTVIRNGYHGDASRMFYVGEPSKQSLFLMKIAGLCTDKGISLAVAGNTVGDIGYHINKLAKSYGLNVVKEFGGHGIGFKFHEEPFIPSYGSLGDGIVLEAGMAITIEPIITFGTGEVEVLDDGWTVVSKDGAHSAQWEDTIIVGDKKAKKLT